MIQLPVDWRFSHPDVPLSLSSLLLRIPFLPFSQKAKCAFSFDVCCTFIRPPPLDRVKGPPVGWRSTAIELRRLPMYGIFSFLFFFEKLLCNLMFSTLDGWGGSLILTMGGARKNPGSGLIKNGNLYIFVPFSSWWLVGRRQMLLPNEAIVCLPPIKWLSHRCVFLHANVI